MILLLHIPGIPCQVVQDAITAAVQPAKVLWAGAPIELVYHTDQELADADLMVARMGYRIAERIGRNVQTIVFLRDPVARVVAHYQELSGPPGSGAAVDGRNGAYAQLRAELLGDRPISATTQSLFNVQTCALHSDFWPVSRAALKDVPDSDLLAQAKANLEQVTFVGIAERMDQSLRRLREHFGWPPADTAPGAAAPEPYQDIPADLAAVIRERNRLDAALYEHALDLSETRGSP